MAWRAEEAIEEARELHPAFDKQATPDSVLLRALNRYHGELYDRIVNIDPHFFAEEWKLDFPLDDELFAQGVPIPMEWDTLLGGDIYFEDTGQYDRDRRLNFVPFGNRHHPGCRYPATIIGGKVRFIGRPNDWDLVDFVKIYYVPQVSELTSTEDVADLPDRAKGVCVERIALTAASRASGIQSEPVDMGYTMEDWRESEEEFLNNVARPARAETAYIRDVW